MAGAQSREIILTNWNAGVFRAASLPMLLPELAIYSLLYDEVLIREEDLITNRAICRFLSDEVNFAIFSELLIAGFVKLLRLPVANYPLGRQFNPAHFPISARSEEHQLRRTYKGKQWTPTFNELKLFRRLDEIVTSFPGSSRFHRPFDPGNTFAAQLGEILENRESYRLPQHPVFGHINEETADRYVQFCNEPEAWVRFLSDRGVSPLHADSGFYRSASYQCAKLLPTPRAIRRLVESVYAATYCEREHADGRYGGTELVELPFRYNSYAARQSAQEEALRVELVPTGATAQIALHPGIAQVLSETRASQPFHEIRAALSALGAAPESPILSESRVRGAWLDLCAVYAENSARLRPRPDLGEHKICRFAVFTYLISRVLGYLVIPNLHVDLNLEVVGDAAVVGAIEKFGPELLKGFRAFIKIPAIREQMANALGGRVSRVPLTIGGTGGEQAKDVRHSGVDGEKASER